MLGAFSTVGCAAGLFQKSVRELREGVRALNIQPVLSLNCLHYYRDEDWDAVNRHINLGTPDTPRGPQQTGEEVDCA
jgi:hypothetical protein